MQPGQCECVIHVCCFKFKFDVELFCVRGSVLCAVCAFAVVRMLSAGYLPLEILIMLLSGYSQLAICLWKY